ncbi:type II toxin-antitoxin system RelE/ParE family toxin [Gallibacterium trehalosifermentans]|uniref:Type II toxin-antitoxin system RelE/ParE family toxin n=1 Tax=Gallibacterium trehalosifermentans TaxID=516935 RepID=A0ABV6GZ03_9PAST
MILSFKHKGVELFFKTGKTTGIQAKHANKLRLLLTALNAAKSPYDMNVPSWSLHQLQGNLLGHWSVKVNGNWRLTFKFENGHAEIVDYQDYH